MLTSKNKMIPVERIYEVASNTKNLENPYIIEII